MTTNDKEPTAECDCEACKPQGSPFTDDWTTRMILCAVCGNKRCPHATDHRNACTGSNAIGQKGSSWEHVKPVTPSAQAALQPQSDAEIEALEREHFGCIEAGTGIYAPREALKEFEVVRAMCGGGK